MTKTVWIGAVNRRTWKHLSRNGWKKIYADSNVESYEKVLNQVLIGKLLEEIMDKDVKKT